MEIAQMCGGLYGKAELLAALWRLGGDAPIPTGGGVLDRVLHISVGLLPDSLRDGISFSATSVGLRCLELPDIFKAGNEVMVFADISPCYTHAEVRLGLDAAREIVVEHGLTTVRAAEIGSILHQDSTART